MLSFSTRAIFSILAASQAVNAHTWVEFLRRINAEGSFAPDTETGFPIPYVPRSKVGFIDDEMQNKILDTKGNPFLCKQGAFEYTDNASRLAASPGDYIAMLYQENGHVTQPELTTRPFRGGNVYVYGTLEAAKTARINDVLHQWNQEGTGGDGRGQLIGSHFFDDEQCYQNTGGVEPDPKNKVWTTRQQKYGVDSIMCQTAFKIPDTVPSDGIYNVMWAWEWPLLNGDGTFASTEIYTSCAEIDLRPRQNNAAPVINFVPPEDVENAAIQSQVEKLIEVTTLGVGQNAPPVARAVPARFEERNQSASQTLNLVPIPTDSDERLVPVTVDSASETTAPRSIPTQTTFRMAVKSATVATLAKKTFIPSA